MIKCPNPECGHENVDGTQFCEACGEELDGVAGPGSATSGASATTATTTAPNMIKCPQCDNLNPADNVVCEVCGSDLHPAGSASAGSVTAPAATSSTPSSDPTSSVSANPSSATNIVPSADTLATGTATPPTAATLPDVSSTGTVGASTITGSTTAPDALTGMAPDVGGAASASGMPVVATGDTTSGIDPTATGSMVGVPDVGASAMGAGTSDPVVTVSSGDSSATTSSTPAMASGTPGGNLQPGAVKLTVEQGMTVGKQFVLGDSEILVGREDDEEGIYPDVDLSDQDEGYVHRKHATLKFENGGLMVTHLGGANKTRINNRPLPDNTPQPVNIGDKVSFGKVVMRVGAV